ncbi:MAG: glycosyltransferase [Anaerolineales bacterium]|nr:glycosyltransferase [Anaerolineales bacterium]
MKVSVLIITYNHEQYIAEAVQSVLTQKTTFDYEIVVGEDCSTDETRNILVSLTEKYPDRIKLLFSERNQGVHRNLVNSLAACKGKYIAFLDGDDLWTSNDKLEIQANYMDEHPNCAVSFHNATIINEDNSQIIKNNYFTPGLKRIFTSIDIVKRNFIPNCTVMFKRGLIEQFPPWFYEIPAEDRALHILNAQHGTIEYIDLNMAAYRIHSGGVYSNLSHVEKLKNLMVTLTILDENFYDLYHELISPIISDIWDKISIALVEEGFNLGIVDAHTIGNIFDSWPDKIPFPQNKKRVMITDIYERLLFYKYHQFELEELTTIWLKLIMLDPKRLQNKGIFSIGLQIFLFSPLRKLIHTIIAAKSRNNLT